VETGRQHLVSGMQPHKKRRLIKDSALAIGSLSSIILGYSRLVHLSQCTHSSFPVLSFFSIAFTKGAIDCISVEHGSFILSYTSAYEECFWDQFPASGMLIRHRILWHLICSTNS
jgi:hypothetical protein